MLPAEGEGGKQSRLKALVREYVMKALREAGRGMKALLMDEATAGVVGCVLSHSTILAQEVYLVQTLEKGSTDAMAHLKAVVFARPSHTTVQHLRELVAASSPLFGEYHLFFTNIARDAVLQDIADADSYRLVQQVHEYFADFAAVDPHHFTLDMRANSLAFTPPAWAPPSQQPVHDRVVEGVASALLSLRRRPAIRYQKKSHAAQRVAEDVHRLAFEQEAGLFDFRRADGLVLLIVDRLDDPVSPLLSQWTYQAMVHELLGMHLNRVSLSNTPNAKQLESSEVVLDEESDEFYRNNMHGSYGELGTNLKQLVDDFQAQSKSKQNVQTIEDMQRFVESYPEFRARQTNVSKHVALMTELSREVDDRQLMRVSQCEQELACGSDRSSAYDEAATLIRDRAIKDFDKLRIAILFALRYEREAPRQVRSLLDLLSNAGVPADKVRLAEGLLRLAGESSRTGDLYGNQTFMKRASKMVGSLKGVDNIYTQHVPLLNDTIESLVRGKLREADYPYVSTSAASQATASANSSRDKPSPDVLLFVLGGTTYEEVHAVEQLNARSDMPRILLGGTKVQNSSSFLKDVEEALQYEPSASVIY